MSLDDLPNDFDIVVLGTGVTQTITAAAFSRIGLKVLHLDRNDYYGGVYSNFSLDALIEWQKKNELFEPGIPETFELTEGVQKLLSDGESAMCLPKKSQQGFHIKSQFHVRDRTKEEEAAALLAKQNRFRPLATYTTKVKAETTEVKTETTEVKAETTEVKAETAEVKAETTEVKAETAEVKATGTEVKTEGESVSERSEKGSGDRDNIDRPEKVENVDSQCGTQTESLSTNTDRSLNKDTVYRLPPVEDNPCDDRDNTAAGACGDGIPSHKQMAEVEQEEPKVEQSQRKEWTSGDLKDNSRRFCFDLSPKILHCCGDMIDLLVRSDVARYCEFRTVSRVLTLMKGQLQQVPCSRADVFSSNIVSLIEKRMMMKFMQFAAVYKTKPEEYKDFKDKPFIEFLKSKKLTSNLQHFIQHSIAMVTDQATTEESLAKTSKFLHSLGKYGNTAFLFPLYGTGELPQGFARLSAVFGGVYCLNTTASHLVYNDKRECTAIITSAGQRISCKTVVAEMTYLPDDYITNKSNRKISRAIFITNKTIKSSQDQELSLLRFVCKDEPSQPVTVLELPHSAMVCPKDLYIVHLTRVSTCDDPEHDFIEVKEKLFNLNEADSDRPAILWSMYFHLADRSYSPKLRTDRLTNVLWTSGGGDDSIDLDQCVTEANATYGAICPDEEFLPHPPNPDDIIHIDDTETAVASDDLSEFHVDESISKTNNLAANVEDLVTSTDDSVVKTVDLVDKTEDSCTNTDDSAAKSNVLSDNIADSVSNTVTS